MVGESPAQDVTLMIRAGCGEESGALCSHAKHGQHVPAFVEIFDRRLGSQVATYARLLPLRVTEIRRPT